MHSYFGWRAWDKIKNENCVAEKVHIRNKKKIQKTTVPLQFVGEQQRMKVCCTTENDMNGQLKNYGDAFIQGNKVLYISSQKTEISCLNTYKEFIFNMITKCCMQGDLGRL
jgi:hypothetical protein